MKYVVIKEFRFEKAKQKSILTPDGPVGGPCKDSFLFLLHEGALITTGVEKGNSGSG